MISSGSGVRGAARLAVVALVASSVAVAGVSTPASPQSRPPADDVVAFDEAPPVSERTLSPMLADELAGAARSRFVEIPAGSVAETLGATVTLELFSDVTVTLEGDPAPVEGANGSTTWSGLSTDGDYATFTFINGHTIGTVGVDGAVYVISPVSGKTHLIVEDGRVFPNEAEPLPGDAVPSGQAAWPTRPVAPQAESLSDPVIDVLIWYDSSARNYFENNAIGDTPEEQLATTVNLTNAAYANSGVNLSIRSVGIEYVDYTASGDPVTDLDRLAYTADGYLDNVHSRRDAVHADLVSLITDLDDVCGIGFLAGSPNGTAGFTVVDAACSFSNLSFAHELGHNLGAGHAPGDTTPNVGRYPYSQGYRDPVNGFHTIMAYNNGCGSCQRINYFSSPTVLWNGHPTGSATQDNARTISERAPIVAAYRSVTPVAAASGRIATGADYSCALYGRGAVRCWGSGYRGQLGSGNTNNIGDNEAPGSVAPVDLGAGRTAIAVSAGGHHTCAVLDTGAVLCWGQGNSGQLGYGNTNHIGDDETPASAGPIDLGLGRTALQISTGYSFTCALLDDGTVRCWGKNDGDPSWGNLGVVVPCWFGGLCPSPDIGDDETPGSVAPIDLGAGRTAIEVSAGFSHACAVLDNGTVRCWGNGQGGALGYGNTNHVGDNETPGSVGPVYLGEGRTAVHVSAEGNHTCALLDNGTVRCWGQGGGGELGYGNTTTIGDDETPGSVGPVDLGVGRTADQIDAGGGTTCAVLDDGTVPCWGGGGAFAFPGELGYGNTNVIGDDETPGSVGPVDLGVGRTAVQVSTAGRHTCASLDHGTVRCWGYNASGELGNGNTTSIGDNETPATTADVGLVGVAGTVTDAGTGTPVPGAFVAVLRTTDFALAGGAVTDGIGDFTVPVGEGSYYLYLVDPTGAHTTGFHGAPATVRVADESMTEVDPTMASARGSITATVTRTGSSTRIAGVWGLALSASAANPGATELAVIANGSGQLVLPGLTPGNHVVGFVDPTGAHTTRFFPNSPDVPGSTPVTVTAGAATPADVALPAQTPVGTGATISGVVTEQGTNIPLAGARVVALRASDYAMVRGAATNASGQYSLDLAAGAYKLAFFDSTGRHGMEWYDNVPNTGLASAVSVTAPGTADAAMAANTGSMAGTVADDLTATPIGGVWVLAIGPTGVAGGTLTEVDGTYTIAGLAPGTYRATFVDPQGGRSQQYWDNSPDYPGAATFNVTAANTTAGIDAALATPTSE